MLALVVLMLLVCLLAKVVCAVQVSRRMKRCRRECSRSCGSLFVACFLVAGRCALSMAFFALCSRCCLFGLLFCISLRAAAGPSQSACVGVGTAGQNVPKTSASTAIHAQVSIVTSFRSDHSSKHEYALGCCCGAHQLLCPTLKKYAREILFGAKNCATWRVVWTTQSSFDGNLDVH